MGPDSKQLCQGFENDRDLPFQGEWTGVADARGWDHGQPQDSGEPGSGACRLGNATLVAFLPGAALLIWWLLGHWGLLNPYLTPPPGEVLDAGLDALASGELWLHSGVSLARVSAGFALTVCLALPLALIPLLILWLGIGEGPKLAVIVLASFFPIFLNAFDGVKNADRRLLEMAETLDLTHWDTFRTVLLPSALPSVITGLRIGFGYSWRALIGAELIAAASGLGYMILDAEELARTDRMFVGILIIGVLGYLFDAVLSRAAARIGRRLHLSRELRP